jgi:hypothetical protein
VELPSQVPQLMLLAAAAWELQHQYQGHQVLLPLLLLLLTCNGNGQKIGSSRRPSAQCWRRLAVKASRCVCEVYIYLDISWAAAARPLQVIRLPPV